MPEHPPLPDLNPDGRRRSLPPGIFTIVSAFLVPTLLWTIYLFLTRRIGSTSSPAADWAALIVSVAMGLVLLRRSTFKSSLRLWVAAIFVLTQAVWLLILGLVFVNWLARP